MFLYIEVLFIRGAIIYEKIIHCALCIIITAQYREKTWQIMLTVTTKHIVLCWLELVVSIMTSYVLWPRSISEISQCHMRTQHLVYRQCPQHPSLVVRYVFIVSIKLVWGLRLWQAERSPVWEFSWYWLELSALKISIYAYANIKFLEESF